VPNLRDVITGKSSLWPQGRSEAMPTGNRLTSADNFGIPFVSYLLFKDTPYWQQLRGLMDYFEWFITNPIFYAVVMIKAREYANMKFVIKNRRTGEVEPETTRKPLPQKIYKLLNNPNVMQKRWEFLIQRKIFREVCGNTMTYGNAGFGMGVNINNIVALWNVWPQYMEFKLAGKYFDATEATDVIKGWRFKYGDTEKEFATNEILHQNSPNIDPRAGLIFGTPTAASLIRPLSNIDMAYESRNVMMQNRGMRVILSSDRGDASGKIPLLAKEKDEIQEQIKGYGLREGQKQFFFSNMPLKSTPIDQDVRKLGLFEEIATDAMLVCHAFGVPEILLKLYLHGATFENQAASVRRLYQGTLIPESQDEIIAFNSFLGLDDTEWYIEGSFDHVAELQESEKLKADTSKIYSDQYLAELKMNVITPDEFREFMDYGKKPEPKSDDPQTIDARTQEQQAALRGSVGGVQGILNIQAGVSAGSTTYEAGIAMLMIIFGFNEEDAEKLLGDPQPVTQPETQNQNAA